MNMNYYLTTWTKTVNQKCPNNCIRTKRELCKKFWDQKTINTMNNYIDIK